MDLRLIQRDHPIASVNDYRISYRDRYFRDCWTPLLNQRNADILATLADLTKHDDRVIHLSDLGRELGLEAAPSDHQYSAFREASDAADRAALGHRIAGGFCVYRNVPLMDEKRLPALADAELLSHVQAVRDANQRLQVAGLQEVEVPDWISDRLSRAGHAVEVQRAIRPTAGARLDALRPPRLPEAPGPSL